MMRAAIIWLVCIALTAVVVAISYRWLDMPIALWAYHHFYVPHRHFLIEKQQEIGTHKMEHYCDR